MTDRIIIFAENGRASVRGLSQVGEAEFVTWPYRGGEVHSGHTVTCRV